MRIPVLFVLAVYCWPGIVHPAAASETMVRPIARLVADESQQALVALDAQILSAVILAHSVWSIERVRALLAGLASMYPSDAGAFNRIAARWRNDQDGHLDLYSSLILQIATGPARLNVRARVSQVEQDLDEQGQSQFKSFLPLVLKNVAEAQSGTTVSRDQRRAAILAVPSAKPPSAD